MSRSLCVSGVAELEFKNFEVRQTPTSQKNAIIVAQSQARLGALGAGRCCLGGASDLPGSLLCFHVPDDSAGRVAQPLCPTA
mmetsp:Transcript_20377/g.30056  ORF Transcript_20377/g.30056 Transcript_20377/m.30056 type:complete len:82 (-) Transcript_20377:29-274(-)